MKNYLSDLVATIDHNMERGMFASKYSERFVATLKLMSLMVSITIVAAAIGFVVIKIMMAIFGSALGTVIGGLLVLVVVLSAVLATD